MATPDLAATEHEPTPDDETAGDEPTPEPIESTIGMRLREARRAKGLTQQQVADALDVGRRAVSEWETGLRRPHVALPGLEALYGVSATFILYGVEPSSVELRELRTLVEATRADLVTLAESVEAAFADLRQILELRESERERTAGTRNDVPPAEPAQR